jgi:hypothetical protein
MGYGAGEAATAMATAATEASEIVGIEAMKVIIM